MARGEFLEKKNRSFIMKKLKLPKLIENRDLPKTMNKKKFEEILDENHYNFVPEFSFDINELSVIGQLDYSDKGNHVYAYICYNDSATEYYDYAIVKTDDIYFNTYAEWKKAVKILEKQLIQRWKEWIGSLYQE